MKPSQTVDLDAWSESQIQSKLWLCGELELLQNRFAADLTVWMAPGWYGVLALLLLVRSRLKIGIVRSFDIDPRATEIANAVNAAWSAQNGRFRALTADIDTVEFQHPQLYHSPKPDVLINTACEHLGKRTWFERIPKGTLVVLQSTDLVDPDHVARVSSAGELTRQLPISEVLFEGSLRVDRPGNPHHRFMTIGFA